MKRHFLYATLNESNWLASREDGSYITWKTRDHLLILCVCEDQLRNGKRIGHRIQVIQLLYSPTSGDTITTTCWPTQQCSDLKDPDINLVESLDSEYICWQSDGRLDWTHTSYFKSTWQSLRNRPHSLGWKMKWPRSRQPKEIKQRAAKSLQSTIRQFIRWITAKLVEISLSRWDYQWLVLRLRPYFRLRKYSVHTWRLAYR